MGVASVVVGPCPSYLPTNPLSRPPERIQIGLLLRNSEATPMSDDPAPSRGPPFARGAAYLSRASLAAALDTSVSTVDELVRRGILPRPIKLSDRCVRFRWETVDQALVSLQGEGDHGALSKEDAAGVQRAIQAAKERGRGRAA